MKPPPAFLLPHRRAREFSSVILAACLLACVSALHAANDPPEEDLPLPKWTDEELRAFRESGSTVPLLESLLPDVPDYMEHADGVLRAGPRLEELPAELSADIIPRLRVEDLRLFLPTHALPDAVEVRSTSPLLKVVSAEFLQAAFETLRTEYLIDPDVLVPEMPHLQMLRFLEFHARDSRIKLYVLILPPGGVLPASPQLERMASGSLVKSESCLLAYPLGQPERSRLFVSKSVFDLTSTRFLTETAEACGRAASHHHDPFDQLQNYGIELSKRLFWLQKALNLGTQATSGQTDTLAEFAADEEAGAALAQSLAPAAAGVDPATVSMIWALAGVFSATCLYIVGTHLTRWKKKRAQGRVWMLPEVEPLVRLGGAFTGGGGGIIR